MKKPNTLRAAAAMILVTTAMAWGLPVRASDVRTLEADQENQASTASALANRA